MNHSVFMRLGGRFRIMTPAERRAAIAKGKTSKYARVRKFWDGIERSMLTFIVKCPVCGQKNRLGLGPTNAVCGRCRASLEHATDNLSATEIDRIARELWYIAHAEEAN